VKSKLLDAVSPEIIRRRTLLAAVLSSQPKMPKIQQPKILQRHLKIMFIMLGSSIFHSIAAPSIIHEYINQQGK